MKSYFNGKWGLLSLALVIGLALGLSGCATCGATSCAKPAVQGMADGNLGFVNCSKSGSVIFVEKSMPREVQVNSPFDYWIKVTNNANCMVENVIVTERMNENFKYIKASPEPSGVTGNVAQWNLGVMQPNETKLITITGTVPAAGTYPSCTKATYEPLLCVATSAVAPALNVKIQAPQEVLLCDAMPVNFTVTNSGTGVASNVLVTHALPAGLVTTDGKTSVTYNAGTLAEGQSRSFTVNLKATKAGSYAQSASAAADKGLSATSGKVTTSVKQPVLEIKQTGPNQLYVGRNATYEITVKNVGDAVSGNTVVQSQAPSGMRAVSASANGQVSGNGAVWNVGDLKPNQAQTFSVTYQSQLGGAFEAVAAAKGYCCEQVSTKSKTEVRGIPAILLEVVDTDDPIEVGGIERYIITVTNQGSAKDTNIRIKATLEDNFTFVSASGATQPVSSTDKGVEFAPLAVLEAGKKAVWEVRAKAVKAGDSRFAIEMNSEELGRPVNETEATRVY